MKIKAFSCTQTIFLDPLKITFWRLQIGLRSPQTQKLDLLRQKMQFLAYEEEDEDDTHFHKKTEQAGVL